MFFKSKNKKIVEKWEDEHETIVKLAHKVFEVYAENNENKIRKALLELNKFATSHFMNEDLEFYRMGKDSKRINEETKKKIEEFRKTFSENKKYLMNFFSRYSKPNSSIDEEFFENFSSLVEVVGKRIEFEEANLYDALKNS